MRAKTSENDEMKSVCSRSQCCCCNKRRHWWAPRSDDTRRPRPCSLHPPDQASHRCATAYPGFSGQAVSISSIAASQCAATTVVVVAAAAVRFLRQPVDTAWLCWLWMRQKHPLQSNSKLFVCEGYCINISQIVSG